MRLDVAGPSVQPPVVALGSWGVLQGHKATAHPALSDRLEDSDSSTVAARVVEDQHITTSRGPGTAFEFALRPCSQTAAAEKGQKPDFQGPVGLPARDGGELVRRLDPGAWTGDSGLETSRSFCRSPMGRRKWKP